MYVPTDFKRTIGAAHGGNFFNELILIDHSFGSLLLP